MFWTLCKSNRLLLRTSYWTTQLEIDKSAPFFHLTRTRSPSRWCRSCPLCSVYLRLLHPAFYSNGPQTLWVQRSWSWDAFVNLHQAILLDMRYIHINFIKIIPVNACVLLSPDILKPSIDRLVSRKNRFSISDSQVLW